jgi:hypothetical protein
MNSNETIVITACGHEKAVDRIAVSLFDTPEIGRHESNARIYCDNTNSLELRVGAWIFSRTVSENIQYALEAFFPSKLQFDSILNLDDWVIKKMLREADAQTIARALKGEDAPIQNKVFKNMSKRAAEMLKEDMEYMGPIFKHEVNEKQAKILDLLEQAGKTIAPQPEQTDENFPPYSKEEKIKRFKRKSQSIVISVYGHDRTADKIAVNLFDKPKAPRHKSVAKIYCNEANNLELQGGAWVNSRIASENVQYPLYMFLPLQFDVLLNFDDREILKWFREVYTEDLAKALKGEDAPIQNKVFNNMSKRAAEMLKEDMENMTTRESEVKAAQAKILKIARRLEIAGELIIPYSKGERK